MMNRREFLGWVEVGWLASSLPISLSACNKPTLQKPSLENTSRFQSIGSVTDLDKQGFLDAKIDENPIIVIKDTADLNQVYAVNSTCTHTGCTVTWKADDQTFDCPCHGSKFAADGKLLNGPAKDPLVTYEAKLEGEKILVKTL